MSVAPDQPPTLLALMLLLLLPHLLAGDKFFTIFFRYDEDEDELAGLGDQKQQAS